MSGSLHTGDSLIGITVDHGRYEIVKLIGEGGMGRVFQARQISMNRMVALKLLRAQLATDDHLLARFQQEAHAVSKLRHPNTIIVYDYGKTEDGYLFIAMELLGGRSLASILSAETRLTPQRALHIIEQVSGAVAEAHQFGIVHRDLKPENIQIDKVANDPDFAKVLDFGIAKMIHGEGETENRKTLTMAGAVFGTPHYMSPEQVHGQKVDHRTDIYALGVILYELLTGKPVFEGATPMAVMMAQASKTPPDIRDSHPDLDVPDTIADLINDCLVKDANKRLGSANDLIDRIKQAQFELNQDITGSSSGRLMLDPSLLTEEGKRHRANRPGTDTKGRPPGDQLVTRPASDAQALGQAATAPPGLPVASPTDAAGMVSTRSGDSDAEIRLPRRSPLVPILAVALVGGAVAAFLVLRDQGGTTTGPGTLATPTNGQPERILIDDIQIKYKLRSTPSGATVTRDGAVLGRTPLTVRMKQGDAPTLDLALDGFQPGKLAIPGGGANEQELFVDLVKAAINPDAPTAWLHLVSTPPEAEIWQGDKLLGKTPFDWKPAVVDAPAELHIAKKGFKTEIRQFKLIAAKAPEEVKLALVPIGPGVGPIPVPPTQAGAHSAPGPGAPGTAPAPGTKPPAPPAPATHAPKAPESKAPDHPATPSASPYQKL